MNFIELYTHIARVYNFSEVNRFVTDISTTTNWADALLTILINIVWLLEDGVNRYYLFNRNDNQD